MLIVILVVSILMLVVGCTLVYKTYGHYSFENGLGIGLNICGGILGFITLIILIIGTVSISYSSIIDDKIDMYETENTQIQEDIKVMVAEYAEWESDTYEKFAQADPTFIVNMYPELKTSELVNTQLEIYVKNKQEIKRLKSDKLDFEVWKWWVYFG